MVNRISRFLAIVGVLSGAALVLAPAGGALGAPAPKKKDTKKKPPPPAAAPAQSGATPESQPDLEIEVNPDQPAPGQAGQPATGTPPPTIEIEPETPSKPDKDLQLGETQVSWQDVVVVMRKPFLKQNRLELIPSWGVTLNDNMIRHIEFNGQLNYWLTDVLAVGAELQLFAHTFLEPYDLVAQDYRRLPTLNKYNFGGALNFHYVPIYAKFAVLNKFIVHWEGMFTAGVGFTQSEIIPRDPAFPSWTNFLITPNVGFTSRVFLTSWITLDLGVKDYIFIDQFENVNRTTANVDDAKANATSQLINNIVFSAGVSFWIPTWFHYTTFR
jgi:outer membrane beta-barrel protein